MSKMPEILAPAGSFSCLKAAVAAGADAVYFGGQNFNARRGAVGFSLEEIKEALRLCHAHGVKVHLTLNTLVKEKEWPALLDYVDAVMPLQPDAVIVQDIGVARMLRRRYPDIALHASTQMAVQSLEGVQFLEQLGFKRVVLAREVPLKEIAHICASTKMEIEVFVHGALCYSVSGRCLLSSFHGGRSGNRGTCAQPCRMRLTAEDASGVKQGYFFNMKDLCGASHMAELIQTGVASFKIEGRLKGEAYVAEATRYYKGLVEEYAKLQKIHAITDKELEPLKQIFNRGGFTPGYYKGKRHAMIESGSPKHQGIRIGRIQSLSQGGITIVSEKELHSGDEIEIHTGKPPYPGLRLAASMVKDPHKASFFLKGYFKPGMEVWRVVDPVLQQQTLQRLAPVTVPENWEEGQLLSPVDVALPLVDYEKSKKQEYEVAVRSPQQWLAIRESGQPKPSRLFVQMEGFDGISKKDFCQSVDTKIVVMLPPVGRKQQQGWIKEQIHQWQKAGVNWFEVSLLDQILLVENEKGKVWGAGPHLGVMNRESAAFWQERGLQFTLSQELTEKELRDIQHIKGTSYVCYGRPVYMITEQCAYRTAFQCEHRDHRLTLRERQGERMIAQTYCELCYNEVLAEKPICQPKGQAQPGIGRLMMTTETGEDTAAVWAYWNQAAGTQKKLPFPVQSGHFEKGVQ